MAAEHDVDKVVREAFFSGRTSGVLVELGAARPDYLSISASYRTLVWKIVSIEPNRASANCTAISAIRFATRMVSTFRSST